MRELGITHNRCYAKKEMTKHYEIVAEVTFYSDKKMNGKMLAGTDADSLVSALRWFDSEISEKAEILKADNYFVVPLYIGLNQSAISKKYYRDVVIKDDDLWQRWCC